MEKKTIKIILALTIITIVIIVSTIFIFSSSQSSPQQTVQQPSSQPSSQPVEKEYCPSGQVLYSKYYFYGPAIAYGKKVPVSMDNIKTVNGDTYYIIYERPYTKIIRGSDKASKYYTGSPSEFNASNFSRYTSMEAGKYNLGEDSEFFEKTNVQADIPDTVKALDKLLSEKREFISYSKAKNFSYNSLKSIGAWVKLNTDVLDAERPGIIMGNYPESVNTNLNIEIHQNRKPRIYINMGAINWIVNESIPLDTWTHIAFVLKNNSIEYYRDGELKQVLEQTPPTIGLINNIKFGYDNRSGPFYGKFKIKNILVGTTEWSSTEFSKILPRTIQPYCIPSCGQTEIRDKDLEECVCANRYDKLSSGVCEAPCPSTKFRDENDQCIDWVVNGTNGWKYVRGINVAVRLNQNGDVECASNNGKDCLWRGTEEATLIDINNSSFNPTAPLACGEDHLIKWGSTGYDGKHWCSVTLSKLNPSTTKISVLPSSFIRYTRNRKNYLTY